MKKTLLAIAALAASTAAMAQSSVTLYGVADLSIESVKGDKSVTRVTSGNYNTSRFGLKGTEDIGGGLKANFALESGVSFDTGVQGPNNRFWDRASWVGLAGSFGDVRLGRIDTAIGDVAGVVSGGGPQAYDPLRVISVRASNKLRRTDNAVTYVAPVLVPGLTTTLQYSTAAGDASSTGTPGAETVGDNNGKSFGLSLKYAAGPLSAGVGYINLKDNSATAGDQKANATIVYGGYDLGVAKAIVYYDTETNPSAATSGAKRVGVLGTTVSAPISPEFTVVVGGALGRNVSGLTAGTDNVEILTLKGLYTLSKRTTLYAQVANVNNGSGTNLVPFSSGPTASLDKTTRGFAVGVRHAF
jgi:GBP family porin